MSIRNFIFILLTLFVLAEGTSYAQSNDFFSSTSRSNLRFKDTRFLTSGGQANDCLNCPGYNPCNGTDIGGTQCADGNGLLRQTTLKTNLDGTIVVDQVGLVGPRVGVRLQDTNGDSVIDSNDATFAVSPLFAMVGPGALTDNMFGAVADPTRTGAEVTGNVGVFGKGGRPPTKCGNTVLSGATAGNFDETMDPGIVSGLNCGYLRYNPATQNLTIPSGSNNMTGPFESITTMTVKSEDTTPCVEAVPLQPRNSNVGTGCDLVDFSVAPHAFTAIPFGFGNPQPLVAIPPGLYSQFRSTPGVVCNPQTTGDTICVRQSLVQETQTENGISHAEWAFIWSSRDVGEGTPASTIADCGGRANPDGKICVHWFSDYEDSPCKLTAGYDPNLGPNSCRGVATGYGFLDVTEGYFLYNDDAVGSTLTSYPMGPQASFGSIPEATSP